MRSFAFRTATDLLDKARELGIDLPYQDSIAPLLEPFTIMEKKIANRLVVHPMEGFDGQPDGSPGDLARRRYHRFATGGSGLIWFEATSVVMAGRSNPRQLVLMAGTLDGFKRLVEQTRHEASRIFGPSHEPFLVIQLTHSGRFSYPEGRPAPLVAVANPQLDGRFEQVRVLSDDELRQLQDRFVEAARLAYAAGFDGVDVKACHGYLVHELLTSYTRDSSRFGGEDLENRSRFLLEVVGAIRNQVPEIVTAVRLNLYDGMAWPYGFGVPRDGTLTVDLSEPLSLIRQLQGAGCCMINATAGVASHNSFVGRPCNRSVPGDPPPPEHPLEGIARLLELTGKVQGEFPELAVVGTGYSWLRQFFPHVGAAVLERDWASLIGLGRSSFAYPDAPRDLMERGHLDPRKVCVTCSGCTELIRHGRVGGCIVRDREIYGSEYQTLRALNRREAK